MSTAVKNEWGQLVLGQEKAIALASSRWWEGKTNREIAEFQLFTAELCVPFGVFHAALEDCLKRPVWTHELGLNFAGIVKEFRGDSPAPSFEEIVNLIPEEKRVLIVK
jgi:hypothetical protein